MTRGRPVHRSENHELFRALQAAGRQTIDLTSKAENARKRRDHLIRCALDEGWTHQQIAEATGLSRGSLAVIAKRSAES